MTTSILTKQQQRQSLSAKKGPAKGLRNILAQPFENYWPIVNTDKYPKLVTLMTELLPLIKQPTFTIPRVRLKNMSKEERIIARKQTLEKDNAKQDDNILFRKSVTLGINSVTRALEQDNVSCVLLDANVEPPLLVKHIVTMAQNKKIPVLLLHTLKTVTLQTIGFATAAFALKRDIMQLPDNALYALYKLVTEIFKDFEPPESSFRPFKLEEALKKDTMHDGESIKTDCTLTSKLEETSVLLTDVYKYRSSQKERVFIPPIMKKSEVPQISSDEFIALCDDPNSINYENFTYIPKNKRYMDIHEKDNKSQKIKRNETESSVNKSELTNNMNSSKYMTENISKKRKNDITYLSLKVKCIQGNNNRVKATKLVKKKKQ